MRAGRARRHYAAAALRPALVGLSLRRLCDAFYLFARPRLGGFRILPRPAGRGLSLCRVACLSYHLLAATSRWSSLFGVTLSSFGRVGFSARFAAPRRKSGAHTRAVGLVGLLQREHPLRQGARP